LVMIQNAIRHLVFATVLLIQAISWGYVSVQDTAEVLEKGHYRATFEPQFLFTKQTGANIVGRLDSHISDSATVRGIVGVGSAIDFHTGAFLKYSPIPDVGNQPAIAGQVGVVYARYDGEPEVSFRFNPLISKRFETSRGFITPYGSIPLALETRKGRSIGTAQLVGGAQYETLEWKNVHFSAELGLDIKDSFTYIGVGVIFLFDEEKGFSVN
jgi:hypothetical protein